MNVISIVGNLGRDAEVKHYNDRPCVKFTVAVSKREKVDGQWRNGTDWFSCTAWGRRAEAFAPYLTKGKSVAVTGRVAARAYMSRKTGEPACSLEIEDAQVFPAGNKGSDEGRRERSGGSFSDGGYQDAVDELNDDSIPF